jgi:hypothetical protein
LTGWIYIITWNIWSKLFTWEFMKQ